VSDDSLNVERSLRFVKKAGAGLSVILSPLIAWAAAGQAPVTGLGDFKSDGCSLFPDGSYYSCCYVHDVAYWPGGTAEDRKDADSALRACVKEVTGNGFLAAIMYWGVRLGGGPGHDTTYRWGFGWPYPYRKDYAPLTPEERKQLAEKTRRLCATLRFNPATGGYAVDDDKEIGAGQALRICPDLKER
jgi:hypothetical protein